MDHPNIVHVVELLEDSNKYYFVLELMKSGNLMEVLKQSQENNWKLNNKDYATMTKQIVRALNYMHKKNVIHRDLKLENVMVDIGSNEQGKPELILKLTDFGFSKVLETNKKETNKLGTTLYMAPELFKGVEYDHKVDTWALGVMVYMMLSGKYTFTGKTRAAIISKISWSEPDYSVFDQYRLKAKIKTFIKKCLDKNPETRASTE